MLSQNLKGGKLGSHLIKMQPALLHVPVEKDVVFTPRWLSKAIIDHFGPTGACLDPCRGGGAFYDFLPTDNRDWCEIEDGRDFFQYGGRVDWIVSNPPYSCLLSWIRHSFLVADNICYLIPLHRVTTSHSFLMDLRNWGGIAEILIIGTGHTVGWDFGHLLTAVYFQRDYHAGTEWSELS